MTGNIFYAMVVLISLLAISASIQAAAESRTVEKSKSGICHCPGGQYYDRTQELHVVQVHQGVSGRWRLADEMW